MNWYQFHLDLWTFWGLIAQGFYFARFVLQWIASEKEGRIVVPIAFWILSLMGAAMIMVYAFVRNDIVFLIAGILQLVLFSRNFIIARKAIKVASTS